MDSLADLISFGVAPAILAFTLGLRTPLDTICLLWFVSCGLARLARFNATVALIPADAAGKAKYFEGLPIPSSLFLTATMAYWVKQGWFFQSKVGNHDVPFGIRKLWDSKHGYGEIHLASLIFAIWGAMMVSKTLRVSFLLPSPRAKLIVRYQSYKRRKEVSKTRSHITQASIDRHMNGYNSPRYEAAFRLTRRKSE